MTYRERVSPVPGVVLWQQDARPFSPAGRILPDGCMDLIWDGSRLFVAGPDTRARWHAADRNIGYIGLRFSRGIGPGLLDIHADEVRDLSPDLDRLWPSGPARILAEQVAGEREAALEDWLVNRVADRQPSRLGSRRLRTSEQLDACGGDGRPTRHGCPPVAPAVPTPLWLRASAPGSVLRLGRALDTARKGLPLAEVAVVAGFADQAHFSREVRDLAGTTPTRLLDESSR